MKIVNELPGVQPVDRTLLEQARDPEHLAEELEAIALEYTAAIKEITAKLEILSDDYSQRREYGPIHHMQSRLKGVDSIFEKAERYGIADPVNHIDAVRGEIMDIAGVRVICNYREDIYVFSKTLLEQTDIRVIRVKDYIKHPKESGYRSLHVVVAVPVFFIERQLSIPVEIQFRSIAMDTWASLEHELKYKNKGELSEEMQDQLKACARTLAEVDAQMEDLRHQAYRRGQHGW